jgi:hypothetical protein
MTTQFQVEQIITMHSPFTNEDTLVNFRGLMGGGKAMVIPHPKGLQMAVPVKWLSPTPETTTKGTTK